MCHRNPNAPEEWTRKHKSVCKINHTASSGAMEKEVVVEMIVNSKRKLKYVEYVRGWGHSPKSIG